IVASGATNVQITINGRNFAPSSTVTLPSGMSQTSIGIISTRIVVTVNVSYNSPIGVSSLSVRSNGLQSNGSNITINGPNKMIVQPGGDVTGTSTNNPSAQSRFVTYQVRNVDNTAAAGIPIAEDISLSTFSCSQQDPGNVSAHCDATYHTNSNGIF